MGSAAEGVPARRQVLAAPTRAAERLLAQDRWPERVHRRLPPFPGMLSELPGADPHAGWCGRGQGKPGLTRLDAAAGGNPDQSAQAAQSSDASRRPYNSVVRLGSAAPAARRSHSWWPSDKRSNARVAAVRAGAVFPANSAAWAPGAPFRALRRRSDGCGASGGCGSRLLIATRSARLTGLFVETGRTLG